MTICGERGLPPPPCPPSPNHSGGGARCATLASALEVARHLPAVVRQVVRTGEGDGDLLAHLDSLGRWYTAESDRRAELMAAVLTPFGLLLDLAMLGSSFAAVLVPLVTVLNQI